MKSLRTVFVAMAAMTMMLLPMRAWADTRALPSGVQAWDGTIAKDWRGVGNQNNPIVIKTAAQLAGIADSVSKGHTFNGKYIVLDADLYLSDPSAPDNDKHKWVSIGTDKASFRGNFDGRGHTIYYLYHGTVSESDIWREDREPWDDLPNLDFTSGDKGLFGYVENATIENLSLADISIVGGSAAGLVLEAHGTSVVRNCHVSGNIVCYASGVAGLVGVLQEGGLVENCSSSANVYGSSNVGSLVGENKGTIRDCHATGNAHCTSFQVGGFVGYNSGLIERCYATGKVSRSYDYHAGSDCAGFIGRNMQKGVIRECYATGEVNSKNDAAGFCGRNYGLIESCFSTGNAIANEGYIPNAAIFCTRNGYATQTVYAEDEPGTIINCFGTGVSILIKDGVRSYDRSFLTVTGGKFAVTANCSYVNDSICEGSRLKGAGGTNGYTKAFMQSQAFVDTLNFFAALCGTSLWEYRPGDYPRPTGQKASGIQPYLAGGDGSRENPWKISNLEQLKNFRAYVNGGWDFRNQYIELTADIDMNPPYEQWEEVMPENWEPIGKTYDYAECYGWRDAHTYQFRGDFNGNFHELRNLYVNNLKHGQGLFYLLHRGAHIHNLGIVDAHLSTKGSTGAIAAAVGVPNSGDYARVTQCWSSGELTGNGYASGILGDMEYNHAIIKNCYSLARLQASNTGAIYACATTASDDTIANCIYYGDVTKSVFPSTNRYNCFYDYDTCPNAYDYHDYGCSKEEMQSLDFVNRLNYYVDRSNTYDTIQLNYWMHRPGNYPTLTQEQPPLRITFVSNGGSPVVTQSVWPNSHAVRPDAPTLEGNTFVGWYADEALTQVFEFDSVLVNENKTLYAKWIPSTMEPDYTPFQNEFAKTFIIRTPAQLYGFACAVNGIDGVLDASTFEGKTVKLGNDILMQDTTDWQHWGKDLAARNFTPIGTSSSKCFKGTFDGQGYTISGLYINAPTAWSEEYGGLFHTIGKGGKVQNLSLKASVVCGSYYERASGLLAGRLYGMVDNCHVTGYVYNNYFRYNYKYTCAGGMIGYMGDNTRISNCTAHTRVEGCGRVGGFIGSIGSDDTILNCQVTTNVFLKGFMVPAFDYDGYAGGFISYNEGKMDVKDCLVRGVVRSQNHHRDTRVSGFWSDGVGGFFRRCQAYVSVSGYDRVTGFGCRGSYDSCSFKGDVQGHDYVSGFAYEGGPYNFCSVEGMVQGNDNVAGFTSAGGTCNSCSVEGKVQGNDNVAGFAVIPTRVSNSYCKAEVTGHNNVAGFAGSGPLNSCGFEGKVQGNDNVAGFAVDPSNVNDSYSKAEVAGHDHVSGFAVGSGSSEPVRSFAEGSVQGNEYVFGFIEKYRTIKNCYARVNVTGSDYVSGFTNLTTNNSYYLGNVYMAGQVSCGGEHVGALFLENSTNKTVYYDKEVSGLGDVASTQAHTTSEMKDAATYAGWDFEKTWGIRDTINNGYPVLINFYPDDFKWLEEIGDFEVGIGQTYQLQPVIKPATGGPFTFVYTSSDESLVTVSETGLVTANPTQAGRCTITITTTNGIITRSIKCRVLGVAPTGIEIYDEQGKLLPKDTTIKLPYYGSIRLTAKVLPPEADQTIRWSKYNDNNNTKISFEDGLVTHLAPYTSNPSVSVYPEGKSSPFSRVYIGNYDPMAAASIKITEPEGPVILCKGDSVRFEYEVTPAETYDYTVVLTSNNSSYIAINQEGWIKAIGRSSSDTTSVIVTAKVKQNGYILNDVLDTKIVKIPKTCPSDVTGIKIKPEGPIILCKGDSVRFEYEVTPATARDYTVELSLTRTGRRYVVINEEGWVKAISGSGDTTSVTVTANVRQDGTILSNVEDTKTVKIPKSCATYIITAVPNDAAYGSVSGGGVYAVDTKATLTAEPEDGYRFVEWNDGNRSNPRTVTVTEDATYTAIFKPVDEPDENEYYTILAESDNEDFGYVSGGGEYKVGSTVTLRAVANPGYAFSLWRYFNGEEEGTSTSNPLTVTVTKDAYYIAIFEPVEEYYTITAESSDEDAGYVTGGGEYKEGSTVTLRAVANPGYVFRSWMYFDGEEEGEFTSNPLTITVTKDAFYIAIFESDEEPDPEPTYYTINVDVNDWERGYVTGGGEYKEGSTATLRAVAYEGYVFRYWYWFNSEDDEEGEVSTSNPLTVTVMNNAYYIAVFEPADGPDDPIYYTVFAEAYNEGGYVSGDGEYEAGSTAVLTAVPYEGYRFSFWYDGEGYQYEDNPLVVTVTGDAVYMAVFEPDDDPNPFETYTITAEANNNAFGYVLGGGEYWAGDSAVLTAVANPGYMFVQWQDGNTNNPRVVTVTRDATYTAIFAPDDNPNPSETYTITTGANDNAFGYVLGGGEYWAGDTAVLTAVANPGYMFVQWSDGDKINPRLVMVTRNATYMAIFAPSSQPPTANESNLWEGFKVYPNPSDGCFVVETGAMPVSASVYGENGTLVYRGQWPALSRQQMDLSGQASGVYYLRLQAENTVKTVKLIIR